MPRNKNKAVETVKAACRRRIDEIPSNSNENHSSESSSRRYEKRMMVKSKVVKPVNAVQAKQRRRQSANESEDNLTDENSHNLRTETITFQEDDNVVEIAVCDEDGDDFLSEDEDRVSESEAEDGEIASEPDASTVEVIQSNDDEEERIQQSPSRRVIKKAKRRSSVEKQLDDMSTTLKFMQEMMLKNGLFKANEDSADKTVKDKQKSEYETNLSNSETTIYHEAVLPDNVVVQGNETIDNERGWSTDNIQVDPEITFKLNQDVNNSNENIQINRRESSSSEEHIDTSDELLDVDKFIADCQESVRRRTQDDKGEQHLKKQMNQADQIIKDAEENKARMLATPGNCQINFPVIHNQLEPGQINAPLMAHQQATLVDENYLVIGGHVDEALRVHIVNHEYIDFARLLPKDRLSREEDNRMELISKGGSMYFVLVADREVNGSISNFTRWEQAFRVYSNIYTRAYPT